MDQYENKKTPWILQIKEYMKELNLNLNKIENMSEKQLKQTINIWDKKEWEKEVGEKVTLNMYKKYKKNIKEEPWYDNKEKTMLMSRARLNTLDLNDRKRLIGEQTKCVMCDEENENLEHFLLYCPEYNNVRSKFRFMQQPYQEDKEELIAGILLFTELGKEESEDRKNLVKKLWEKRSIKVKQVQT